MPIKITVLSGSRQDETIQFDRELIGLGHDHEDELRFDPSSDPEVEGQSIQLKLKDDRWVLHNRSKNPMFINHDMVRDSASIRSGDLIRLSHDGPDLLFELVTGQESVIKEELSPTNATSKKNQADGVPVDKFVDAVASQEPVTASNSEITVADQRDGGSASPSEFSAVENAVTGQAATEGMAFTRRGNSSAKSARRKKKTHPVATALTLLSIPAGGLAGICITIVLLWVIWKRDPLGVMGPSVAPVAQSNQGSPSNMQTENQTRMRVGGAASEGGIRSRGGENGASQLSNGKAEQNGPRGNSVVPNRPPVLQAMPTHEMNLTTQTLFRYQIPASDPDQPQQNLKFSIDENAPRGVKLDPKTGEITWEISIDHPQETVSIPFRVTDDGAVPLSIQGKLAVNIIPASRWRIIEYRLRDSLYVLLAQPKMESDSKLRATYLTLGSGVAVQTDRLLTSATVAKALAEARKKGWDIVAFPANSQTGEPSEPFQIVSLQLHAVYSNAAKIEDSSSRQLAKAYFDLAVLTLNRETDTQCKLGIVDYPVSGTREVACIGFATEGTPLANPQEAAYFFKKIDLIDAIPPPNQSRADNRPPLLLQFAGGLPSHPYGSVLVDEFGFVLGIYGFEGELPEELASDPIHYASELLPVAAYLKGNGLDFWLPEEIAVNETIE